MATLSAYLLICLSTLQAAEIGANLDRTANRAFPKSSAVIDITLPPYSAKGDGITDNSTAFQSAIADMMGQHKILYVPNGTYLISKSLRYSKKNSNGQEAWGFNTIQGQNVEKTIIKLKDNTFTDINKPESMLWCGGFGSADWFHNNIQDITFNVGKDNPGAVGLQFYSNNAGAVRNVAIVSPDSKGAIGLDLGPADTNGPLIVQHVLVEGFSTGIRVAASVNSQTLEHITLKGQTRIGLINTGQSLAIRGLRSENRVPVIHTEGPTSLIDGQFIGTSGSQNVAAIELGQAPFYARDVLTQGYARSIQDANHANLMTAPKINEFLFGKATHPFPSDVRSLRLEVKEPPQVRDDAPSTWAIVDTFGADPTGNRDSSDPIQKAIDSGASTIFFPGSYALAKPLRVRGKVARLLGVGNWIDYNHIIKPDLIIEDGSAPVILIEHFAPINGGIVVRTSRPVIFRDLEAHIELEAKSEAYLENIATSDLRVGPGSKVWARQLNIENEGTHLANKGADLWVLGYKTERGGTLLHTSANGRSELFGTFSYTTTAGKLAPMFVTEDSSVFAFFNEVCYSGDPFATLIQETQKGITRTIKRGAGGISPYVSHHNPR